MPDNCDNCPVSVRVDGLEREFDRYRDSSSKTHKEMFDRLNNLEQTKSVIENRLDTIDKKLDKLLEWRETQDNKPNKFLDKLKDNAAWMVIAAVLGAMLVRLGIGA